jgi:hypothetical protein
MLPQNEREKGESGEDESEIHTVMRMNLNSSQKQPIITNCFSE